MRATKTIIVRGVAVAAAVAVTASPVGAASTASPTVAHPWSRATSQSMGAAYMTISGKGTPDKLLSASVSKAVAMEAQLHRSMMGESGMMSMKHVAFIPVPASGTVSLKPGGYHVMLMKLKQPLIAGKTFRLTLRFEQAGRKVVTVTVRKR